MDDSLLKKQEYSYDDNGELIKLAKEKNIRIYGMSEYYIEKRDSENPTILLGYANLTEEEIREALNELKKVFIS